MKRFIFNMVGIILGGLFMISGFICAAIYMSVNHGTLGKIMFKENSAEIVLPLVVLGLIFIIVNIMYARKHINDD